MTAALRVVDSGLNSARWNIAMSAALSELHLAGRIPETLRFHAYPRSVLIGRHQVLDQVTDRRECLAREVEIARRITGGGAVYMAPGVLAWDLVVERARLGSLPAASATICGAVASALCGLGFPAHFRAPGDVVVAQRKVSGSAGWYDGNTLVYQGAVLVDADLGEMADLLRLASDRSVRPVASLASLADAVPGLDAVASAIGLAMADALGCPLLNGAMKQIELDLGHRLLEEEIGTTQFIEHGDFVRETVQSLVTGPGA